MLYLIRLVLLANNSTKITVIKELRAVSGAGLKDAVDMLDAGIVASKAELADALFYLNNAAQNAGFKPDGFRIEVVPGYTPQRQPYRMPVKSNSEW